MEQIIRDEISRFIRETPANRFPDSDQPYFDEPLVAFARADNPLFTEYKTVIGQFHLTPAELVAASFPEAPWQPATVICWVLPITASTRASNRQQSTFPSRQWALTRFFGEQVNVALRRHITAWLELKGHRAAPPQLMPAWREVGDSPAGVASTWSERHAAYAAGLGTFSLNDALITPVGIAHRLGSVITDLGLQPSLQTYADRRANCLFYREGTCGACIGRCPVKALSSQGHDKRLCRAYVYDTVTEAVAGTYGVSAAGCGLCQTKVPCEDRIPPGRSTLSA
ncbi:epoxyqueuosine reductase [Geobacter sp. SVR]|uniref:epoxyqueuosine reductase n=1 Tax=Geobacter sp. SVR TaxID=2495594 RepID=UPI00143F009C|nr:epoxyqueuosine reductase [Geobacter sp. SVR]BCS52446.1 (Fe-S)-binding protein [Geobacter sp. SVR]GCF87323.1 (Fe-S)-binding protein [Geobacter sp. SVR]